MAAAAAARLRGCGRGEGNKGRKSVRVWPAKADLLFLPPSLCLSAPPSFTAFARTEKNLFPSAACSLASWRARCLFVRPLGPRPLPRPLVVLTCACGNVVDERARLSSFSSSPLRY